MDALGVRDRLHKWPVDSKVFTPGQYGAVEFHKHGLMQCYRIRFLTELKVLTVPKLQLTISVSNL